MSVCIVNLLHCSDFSSLNILKWFLPLMCSMGYPLRNQNIYVVVVMFPY
jgi:hypothetical protein